MRINIGILVYMTSIPRFSVSEAKSKPGPELSDLSIEARNVRGVVGQSPADEDRKPFEPEVQVPSPGVVVIDSVGTIFGKRSVVIVASLDEKAKTKPFGDAGSNTKTNRCIFKIGPGVGKGIDQVVTPEELELDSAKGTIGDVRAAQKTVVIDEAGGAIGLERAVGEVGFYKQRRPGIVRPVNSSTMTTSPSLTM